MCSLGNSQFVTSNPYSTQLNACLVRNYAKHIKSSVFPCFPNVSHVYAPVFPCGSIYACHWIPQFFHGNPPFCPYFPIISLVVPYDFPMFSTKFIHFSRGNPAIFAPQRAVPLGSPGSRLGWIGPARCAPCDRSTGIWTAPCWGPLRRRHGGLSHQNEIP